MGAKVDGGRYHQHMDPFWIATVSSVLGAAVGGGIAAAVGVYQTRRAARHSAQLGAETAEKEKAHRRETAIESAVREILIVVHSDMGVLKMLAMPQTDTAGYIDTLERILGRDQELLKHSHHAVWVNAHLLGPDIVERFYRLLERSRSWERRAFSYVNSHESKRSDDRDSWTAEMQREVGEIMTSLQQFSADGVRITWDGPPVVDAYGYESSPDSNAVARLDP